jgi:hypothetical protein
MTMKKWTVLAPVLVACTSTRADLVIQNVRHPDRHPSGVFDGFIMSQSFLIDATFDSRDLHAVAVDLRANAPATAHLWISETDSSGRPNGYQDWVTLGSAEVNSATYQTFEFVSQSPFLLEASKSYAVLLTADGHVTWHSGTGTAGPGSDPAAQIYSPWSGSYNTATGETLWKDALTPFVGITVYAVPAPHALLVVLPALATAPRRRRQAP